MRRMPRRSGYPRRVPRVPRVPLGPLVLPSPPSALARRGRAASLAWQVAVAVCLGGVAVLALGPRPAAIPLLYLAAVTPQLVLTDLVEHRLPNRAVLPGYAAALVGLA